VGPGLARDADRTLLPLDAVQGQGAEFRDPQPGIQQGPDDELLLDAPAGVGQPVGLLGPEGLADELVGHVHTCCPSWLVRNRSAIPNPVRLLPEQGTRRGRAVTACPARVFGRCRCPGEGGGNGVGFALLHRRRTRGQGVEPLVGSWPWRHACGRRGGVWTNSIHTGAVPRRRQGVRDGL